MSNLIIKDDSGFLQTRTEIAPDGIVTVKRTQDIESIIEENKRLQNDSGFSNGFTPEGDMKHVARVPLIVWEQWWQEENKRRGKGNQIGIYSPEMHEVARHKLNDPDNKFLRTGLGEIGK